LGAIQTLFKLGPEVAKDLQAHQVPIGVLTADLPAKAKEVAAGEKEAEAVVRAEVLEKADEFIEDAINELDWKQMQDLVAGILRSMGYRTTVSPPGSDRGVDITASPDGLGLQEPRIFVEVKHRTQTPMGAEKIRSFLGGRKPGDKCLYVSTGSFTKEGRYEAERASVPMTLIDLQGLRRLLVEHYENLDAETRALVPLKRLYWPLA
jgi:restriction system protein